MRIQEYLNLRYPEHPGFGEVWSYAKEIPRDGINPVKKTLAKATDAAFVSISNLIHRINCILPVNIINPLYTDV